MRERSISEWVGGYWTGLVHHLCKLQDKFVRQADDGSCKRDPLYGSWKKDEDEGRDGDVMASWVDPPTA